MAGVIHLRGCARIVREQQLLRVVVNVQRAPVLDQVDLPPPLICYHAADNRAVTLIPALDIPKDPEAATLEVLSKGLPCNESRMMGRVHCDAPGPL